MAAEGKRIFYLCDGKVESCNKTLCYKFDGPCKHTENVSHAINGENEREYANLGDCIFEIPKE